MALLLRTTLLLISSLGFAPWVSAQPAPIQVAASDNLRPVLSQLALAFETSTGHRLQIQYGAAGDLTRQIMRESPYEVFLCAGDTFAQLLMGGGQTLDAARPFGSDRLALFIPNGSEVLADPELEGLDTSLEEGSLKRLALADPTRSPFGRAARAALIEAGLWQRLQGHLNTYPTDSDVLQAAQSAHADALFLPQGLAASPALRDQGVFLLLDAQLQRPQVQNLLLLRQAKSGALEFASFMQAPFAQSLLTRFNLALPGATD